MQGTLIFCRGRVVGRALQDSSRAVCWSGAGLRGWSSVGGWMTIHPVYNIQHDRGLRDVSAHHRSGRGGGKVERRVAIPRAVSCSHVQPRASFCRVFSTYFRECSVILTSGAARCVVAAAKKIRGKKYARKIAPSVKTRENLARSRKESPRDRARPGIKGSKAAKGRTGWEIIGRSVRGV